MVLCVDSLPGRVGYVRHQSILYWSKFIEGHWFLVWGLSYLLVSSVSCAPSMK